MISHGVYARQFMTLSCKVIPPTTPLMAQPQPQSNLQGSIITREELFDLREQIRKFNIQQQPTAAGLSNCFASIWEFVTTPRHLVLAGAVCAATVVATLGTKIPSVVIIPM